MVDDAAVDFLWNPEVEAASACLHVEYGNFSAFGRNHCKGAVCVSQQKQRIGSMFAHDLVGGDDDLTDGLCSGRAGGFQKNVRLADAEFAEENTVKLVVVVLARVHQHVVTVVIQLRDHPRKPDDLGPGTHDGHDLKL
jgi:hypothetical protein